MGKLTFHRLGNGQKIKPQSEEKKIGNPCQQVVAFTPGTWQERSNVKNGEQNVPHQGSSGNAILQFFSPKNVSTRRVYFSEKLLLPLVTQTG